MSKRKIVVVGAGAVGLRAGLELARRGCDVTLIDGDGGDWDQYGASASLAAAGMLAPLSEAALAPADAHPYLLELFLAGFEQWRAEKAAFAFFRGGYVFGAALAEKVAAVAERGRRGVETLAPEDASARLGLKLKSDAALYVADEGRVRPVDQMRAWLSELRALGGKIHFNIEAETIEKKPWGLAVRCLSGEMFSADQIVLAPGAWARDTLIEAAPALRHVRPAKGQLIEIALKGKLEQNLHGPDFYLAARGEDRALLGSSMQFDRFDRRPDPEVTLKLALALRAALPEQNVNAECEVWAGVRAMSPDWAPMVGRSGEHGALVACGHSRNGWLLAPLTAKAIAALALEEEAAPLWAGFGPERFD